VKWSFPISQTQTKNSCYSAKREQLFILHFFGESSLESSHCPLLQCKKQTLWKHIGQFKNITTRDLWCNHLPERYSGFNTQPILETVSHEQWGSDRHLEIALYEEQSAKGAHMMESFSKMTKPCKKNYLNAVYLCSVCHSAIDHVWKTSTAHNTIFSNNVTWILSVISSSSVNLRRIYQCAVSAGP